MSPEATTIIEGLQPHVRGEDYVNDPLWILHDLARIDRHRLLHLTVAQLEGIGVGGDNLHVVQMMLQGVGPDVQDGTELGRCIVRPIDPGRPVHMKVTPEPQIIFKEGPRAGRAVLSELRAIRQDIQERVVSALEGFLS